MNVRYQDRYTGETYELEGTDGAWTILRQGDRVIHVLTDSFERAYEAIDLVARRDGHGWELWLGQSFQGTLSRTSRGYVLVLPDEVVKTPCRSLWDVADELDLAPGTRVWGLS